MPPNRLINRTGNPSVHAKKNKIQNCGAVRNVQLRRFSRTVKRQNEMIKLYLPEDDVPLARLKGLFESEGLRWFPKSLKMTLSGWSLPLANEIAVSFARLQPAPASERDRPAPMRHATQHTGNNNPC